MLNISKLVLCAGQPSYLRPPSHCGSFNILHRPNLKGTSLCENHCLAVIMMLALKYRWAGRDFWDVFVTGSLFPDCQRDFRQLLWHVEIPCQRCHPGGKKVSLVQQEKTVCTFYSFICNDWAIFQIYLSEVSKLPKNELCSG